ncbi:hypothetical protein MTR_8g099940 [Medicago truncatula]|uniref:Uncharacterized protein n=1 Tax=Medicago truncatula TaxID=3880 RepID=G7LIS2_MEDTR|nr:hypothetical protein MTR_8g099940 [Medicago truncatula]
MNVCLIIDEYESYSTLSDLFWFVPRYHNNFQDKMGRPTPIWDQKKLSNCLCFNNGPFAVSRSSKTVTLN